MQTLSRRLPLAIICGILFCRFASAIDVVAFNALTNNSPGRVVWLQGGDALLGGGALMGYDSRSDVTMQILAAAFYQNRPILCHGGNSVVVSINYTVYIVNWDGTGKKKIVNGFCSDVWKDPSGREWVVVRQGGESTAGHVYRYLIDDTTQSVEITDLPLRNYGFSSMNWYQLSGDGLLGVDFMPWPTCVAQIFKFPGQQTDTIFREALGCWSSVASDSSHYWFCFSSSGLSHAGLMVFKDSVEIGEFPLNAGPRPPNTSDECYHPRFASKGGDFLTLSSGYSSGGSEAGTPEIYFGKFNAAHNGFSGWIRITDNNVADYCPDAWVGIDSAVSILLGPSQLHFDCDQGGAAPAAQTVTAAESYGGMLSNVEAVSDRSWLTVNAVQQSNGQYIITNTVTTATLPSGLFKATVTVGGASIPNATYPVSVVVNGTQVATTLSIEPHAALLPAENLMKFTASVLDQRDSLISPQPPVKWSLEPPDAGTLLNGILTAGVPIEYAQVIAQYGPLADTASIAIVPAEPLSILAPSGGVYTMGTVLQIKWAASADVPGVGIQVSPDDGKDYYSISPTILPSSSQWENYAWTIPESIDDGSGGTISLLSNHMKVRVYDYTNPSQAGTSAPFTVTAQNAVKHDTSPHGAFSVRCKSGTLDITMPIQHMVTLEIYTIEGKLVGYSAYNATHIFRKLPPARELYIVKISSGTGCGVSCFVKNQ